MEKIIERINYIINNIDQNASTKNERIWKLNNETLITGVDKDGVTYLSYMNKPDTFKDYLENLDDDVFVEACDLFKTSYGNEEFVEFNELLQTNPSATEEYKKMFKNCVKDIVTKRVEYLTKKYEL